MMSFRNLLFLLLLVVQIMHIKCQTDEEAESEDNEAFEEDWEKELKGKMKEGLFPDLTCHPKYKPENSGKQWNRIHLKCKEGEELKTLNEYCREPRVIVQGLELSRIPDYRGSCPNYCLIHRLGFLRPKNILSSGWRAVRLQPNALYFKQLLGPELGLELSQNVFNKCYGLFEKIFNSDNTQGSKNPCDNERAKEVFDCVNKALKCRTSE